MSAHSVRMFDDRLSREWVGFTILRRAIIAIAVVHFSLAAVSGYRAIVQVYSVAFDPLPTVIVPGSPIAARFVTSGRTFVSTRIELLQGGHVEQIGSLTVPMNDAFFYDPRSKSRTITTTIPVDVLERFAPGPVTIRAVAEGQSQLLRIPPPKISQATVTLAPGPRGN
jgi:hypothetical protein